MAKPKLALLRGINVGGKNKVPMAELRACLEDLGYENVQSYIASGNVIFESPKSASALKGEIEKVLPKKFRLDSAIVNVLVLTHAQLEKIIEDAPRDLARSPTRITPTPSS